MKNSRDNKQKVLLWIDKDIYKQVKYVALDKDTTATEIISKAVEEYLEKNKNN